MIKEGQATIFLYSDGTYQFTERRNGIITSIRFDSRTALEAAYPKPFADELHRIASISVVDGKNPSKSNARPDCVGHGGVASVEEGQDPNNFAGGV